MLQAQKQIVQLQHELECSSVKVRFQSSMTCIKTVTVKHAFLRECLTHSVAAVAESVAERDASDTCTSNLTLSVLLCI